ncbi:MULTISPECIES: hypothetical protein [unclassified Bosea (in: a-proteobacteria)]|uniref:phage major capsid protein n=1 Tax=unclassified Bosea (in: a-proteobacteria) TaxID=2653178 RepID=UPI000F7608D8|nr:MULTISPECIES: hypothetical protein [unclassified Bosea (in: a-proteobacteria)]AZO77723.1 hypothetical protein BLM15_08915 [Bosea sp. Tri-49]RXT18337.1 hypothetical protein B5U98_24070 [Bosea sp. Tri-39]RXT32933.1 hypothetical protein B5U99_30415 [Bosea sp. Tri-54]
MKGRNFAFGAICAGLALAVALAFYPDVALAAPLARAGVAVDPSWGSLALHATPALIALRAQLTDLTGQAERKLAEVIDGLEPERVRAIEAEHGTLIRQADGVRTQIAAEEARIAAIPSDGTATLLAERARSTAIVDIAKRAGYTGTEAADAIASGTTADAFRIAAFDVLAARQTPTSTTRVEADARDKLVEGATRGLLLRAGHKDGERNEFTGMRLERLAEEALSRAGLPTTGNRLQMIGRAFTMTRAGGMHATGDFPVILEAVANKSMLTGWETADTTYQIWTKKGSLSDFKIASRYGVGPLPMLKKKPEGTAYEYATLADRKVTVMLATFGQAFSLTREMIINDDLDAFTDIPRKQGIAARMTVDSLPYALLVANAAFQGGNPLFHASRLNLAGAGGGAPAVGLPSADAFEAAASWMRTKHTGGTDSKTRYRIKPKFGLFPVAQAFKVDQLLTSVTELGQTNPSLKNRARGFVEPVFSDWLDDASATAWYLAADKTADTVEVSFLDGVEEPFLDQDEDWDVDGKKFKVRIDAGASPLDPRGLFKNPGA